MKKLLFTLAIIAIAQFSYAQFGSSGGNTTTMDNVGIGTVSPGAPLHVLKNGAGYSGAFYNSSATGEGVTIRAGSTSSQNALVVQNYDGSSSLLNVRSDGNVGIGTASPVVKLDVNGNINIPNNDNLTWGGTYGAGIPTISANNSVGLYFYPGGSTSGVSMGMNPNGNVGIGTTSPSTKLQVAGQIFANAGVNKNLISFDAPGTNYGQLYTDATNDRLYLGGSAAIATIPTAPVMTWDLATGNVGVGTNDPLTYKLAVNGSVIATSMTVKLYADWPDYVFKPKYQLPTLTEVKNYINENQHLPDMPSTQEVLKNGINLGEIVKIQTKKIEELTLYAIDQQRQVEELKQQQKATNQANLEQINYLKEQIIIINKSLTKNQP